MEAVVHLGVASDDRSNKRIVISCFIHRVTTKEVMSFDVIPALLLKHLEAWGLLLEVDFLRFAKLDLAPRLINASSGFDSCGWN